MQENPTVPHVLILVSNFITAILSIGGTLTALWFKGRREPAEVRRIDAETHNLQVTTEIAPIGISLELLRELQAVRKKAEDRAEQSLLKEDQMRGQILFWRNKAEELDGQLIESKEEAAQLQTRYNLKKAELEKAMGLLQIKHVSYGDADQPKDRSGEK
jgi:hypothetical protein